MGVVGEEVFWVEDGCEVFGVGVDCYWFVMVVMVDFVDGVEVVVESFIIGCEVVYGEDDGCIVLISCCVVNFEVFRCYLRVDVVVVGVMGVVGYDGEVGVGDGESWIVIVGVVKEYVRNDVGEVRKLFMGWSDVFVVFCCLFGGYLRRSS